MIDDGPHVLATGYPGPGRCSASFPAHIASKTYEYGDGRRICARHLLGKIGPQLTLANGFAGPGHCKLGHKSLRVWSLGDGKAMCGVHLREAIRIATWPSPPATLQ